MTHRLFRTSTATYAVLLCAVAATWPTWRALGRYWWDIYDYQHGALVALVVIAWLIVLRRRIEAMTPMPSRRFAFLLIPLVALWLVTVAGNSALAQQILLPAIALVAVLAALGREVARVVFLPLSYLYFAIPMWDYFVPWLQRLTVAVTEQVLGVLGIPAILEGTSVTIPAGTFDIVADCSGKRYLVIALATACIAGIVARLPRQRLLMLCGCTVLLALFANWVRVLIVVVAGQVTEMRHYFVAVEHQSLGTVVFALLIVAVVGLSRILARDQRGAPAGWSERATRHVGVRLSVAFCLPFVVLAAPMVVQAARPAANSERPRLGVLPLLTARWQGPLPPSASAWRPRYLGVAGETRAAYATTTGQVEIYANVYGTQRQGEELIHFTNSLFAPGSWSDSGLAARSGSLLPVSMPQPRVLTASSGGYGIWIVSYVYRIGSFHTANDLSAQLAYGTLRLFEPVNSGVAAVAARCEESCVEARSRVDEFWRDHGAALLRLIEPAPVEDMP